MTKSPHSQGDFNRYYRTDSSCLKWFFNNPLPVCSRHSTRRTWNQNIPRTFHFVHPYLTNSFRQTIPMKPLNTFKFSTLLDPEHITCDPPHVHTRKPWQHTLVTSTTAPPQARKRRPLDTIKWDCLATEARGCDKDAFSGRFPATWHPDDVLPCALWSSSAQLTSRPNREAVRFTDPTVVLKGPMLSDKTWE